MTEAMARSPAVRATETAEMYEDGPLLETTEGAVLAE